MAAVKPYGTTITSISRVPFNRSFNRLYTYTSYRYHMATPASAASRYARYNFDSESDETCSGEDADCEVSDSDSEDDLQSMSSSGGRGGNGDGWSKFRECPVCKLPIKQSLSSSAGFQGSSSAAVEVQDLSSIMTCIHDQELSFEHLYVDSPPRPMSIDFCSCEPAAAPKAGQAAASGSGRTTK